jgi:hypothetical protein
MPILDQHALGIAGDQLGRGDTLIIGEQDSGFVVPEFGDEELAEGALAGARLLLEEARCAVLAMRA